MTDTLTGDEDGYFKNIKPLSLNFNILAEVSQASARNRNTLSLPDALSTFHYRV